MQDTKVLVAQELRNNQLTIRIPQRIRDAIDAQAKADRRTTADVVNNVLAERYPLPAEESPSPSIRARRQRRWAEGSRRK